MTWPWTKKNPPVAVEPPSYDHEAQHNLVEQMIVASEAKLVVPTASEATIPTGVEKVVTPPISSPQPQQGGSTMSFLSTVGKDFKAVFSWLGSAKGQKTITAVETTTAGVVSAINPAAGAVLIGFENLFNAGLKQVLSIESIAAAAGEQDGTGLQKAAAVATAVEPQSMAFLLALGVSKPTVAQIDAISNIISKGLVSIGNELPATAAEAAALDVPQKAA